MIVDDGAGGYIVSAKDGVEVVTISDLDERATLKLAATVKSVTVEGMTAEQVAGLHIIVLSSGYHDITEYVVGRNGTSFSAELDPVKVGLAIADQTVTVDNTTTTLPAIETAGSEATAATKVAISTKPHLTYKLLAGTDPAAVTSVCDRIVGDGTPKQLENGANGQTKFEPADAKAVFFKVTVEK